jgi:ABC-2 type transport system ATP-binding protein
MSTTTAPNEQTAAVVARSLTKRFGARTALGAVSFEVRPGELVAIIGPNGAGKTTLLSIVAGVMPPDEGDVSRPPGSRPFGWVPQQVALYSKLSVAENLRLFARLERLADPEQAVSGMLEQTGLEERADEEVGHLSGGNQQRVNIGIGLLGQPSVLLLDEPSASLDPRQRERLWDFILRLAGGGTTVMFSTHDVAEAERYGERVLVLADGELLFDGTPGELERAVGGRTRDFETAFVSFLRERGH